MQQTLLHLTRPWDETKEKLKETNIALTDEDLQYTAGQEEIMLARVGKKLRKSRNAVIALIESIQVNKDKAG